MEIELSVTVDEEETDTVQDILSVIGSADAPARLLTHRDASVLRALWKNPDGVARRIIHQAAVELDDSPFNDADDKDQEREEVGDSLYRLKEFGLAEKSGQRSWKPNEDIEIPGLEGSVLESDD